MHSRAPINVARCGNRVGSANGQARAPINVVVAQVLAPIRGGPWEGKSVSGICPVRFLKY